MDPVDAAIEGAMLTDERMREIAEKVEAWKDDAINRGKLKEVWWFAASAEEQAELCAYAALGRKVEEERDTLKEAADRVRASTITGQRRRLAGVLLKLYAEADRMATREE